MIGRLSTSGTGFRTTIRSVHTSSHIGPIVIRCPIGRNPRFGTFVSMLLVGVCHFGSGSNRHRRLRVPTRRLSGTRRLGGRLIRVTTRRSRTLVRLCFSGNALARSSVHTNLGVNLSGHRIVPVFYADNGHSVNAGHLVRFVVGITPNPLGTPGFLSASNRRVTTSRATPTITFMFGDRIRRRVNRVACFHIVHNHVTRNARLIGAHANGGRGISRLFTMTNEGHVGIARLVTNSVNYAIGLGNAHAGSALTTPSTPIAIRPVMFPRPHCHTTIGTGRRNSRRGLNGILGSTGFRSPAVLIRCSGRLGRAVVRNRNRRRLGVLHAHVRGRGHLRCSCVTPGVPCHRAVAGITRTSCHRGGRSNNTNRFNRIRVVVRPCCRNVPRPGGCGIPNGNSVIIGPGAGRRCSLP